MEREIQRLPLDQAVLSLLRKRLRKGHEHRTTSRQEYHEETRGRCQASHLRHQGTKCARTSEHQTVLLRVTDSATHVESAHLSTRE